MTALTSKSLSHVPLPLFPWRLVSHVVASCIPALILAIFLLGSSARAQTLTYGTDWLGNTFSGTNNAHVPNGISAIAVTPGGTTYANSWYDEAAGEVSEFTSAPAWVNFNGYLHGFGRSGGYAIAANSTYVYVAMSQAEDLYNPYKTGTQAGQPYNNSNGLPEYPVDNSGSPNYTAITGNIWYGIRRYSQASAGPSGIATYGYSDSSVIIVSTTENDAQLGTSKNPDGASIGTAGPVLGIAANNTYVFASDNANNEIHIYNASTMAPVATWTGIPSPSKMALDNTTGILWVVENGNNNASSSIVGYDATITGTPTPKGGSIACGTGQKVGAPNALAVDSSDRLVIADNGVFPATISDGRAAPYVLYPNPDVAQIAVYTTGGANPVYSYTFGQSVFSGSTPGTVAPMGFHGITGLAFDSTGSFYVSCAGDPHDVGTGTYIRKFTSDATSASQTWQITGLQFVAGGSLDPANLNQFYSSYSNYSINWSNAPLTGTGTGTTATWNMDSFNPGQYPTDKPTSDVSTDWLIPGNAGDNSPLSENHPMVFEVRDIQGKPFLFTDAMNMGNFLGVMRMNGNVAVPACLFGFNRGGWPSDVPKSNCLYWNDANGDGCMQASEFISAAGNADNPLGITLCGKWIDDNANIWSAVRATSGTSLGEIVELTLANPPLNAYGVPQYNFGAPKDTWVAGTNNVTTDTDWAGIVQVAYLPASDTMVVAGNTSTHTSGATNTYDVVRAYPNWSTATTANKIAHAWEADGTSWKGFYAAGHYVFASAGVNNVNAISVYALSAGTFMGTFTPVGVSPTGLNDEDNPINARVLNDGSYVIFQENDLTNNNTIYHWTPPGAIPVISVPPTATVVAIGQPASFTVQATGTALTYQWLKDGAPISGATSTTYTISSVAASDTGAYSVAVSNSSNTVTSATAQLTALVSQQTVESGQSVPFTATPSGTAYQWAFNGTSISGATGATYTIPGATGANSGIYSVVVTTSSGNVTSYYGLTVSPSATDTPLLPWWALVMFTFVLFLAGVWRYPVPARAESRH